MKSNIQTMKLKPIVLAIQLIIFSTAFTGSFVNAQVGDEISELTKPTNEVEIGVVNTSKGDSKFGEYNGLNKSGGTVNGAINIRGGSAYDQEGGTIRWGVSGNNLGTSSRDVNVGISDQGGWDVKLRYDELEHNITNTYQTPFQGAVGGNTFTLPSSFGVINTSNPNYAVVTGGTGCATGTGTSTSATTCGSATYSGAIGSAAYGANALTSTQQGLFTTRSISTDRKNAGVAGTYNIDRQWSISLDFNHLEQSGAKLTSVATNGAPNGAANPTVAGSTSGVVTYGQGILVLPMPTNYTTDTLTLGLNHIGEKSTFSASYFGSFFKDGYSGLNFSNPYVATTSSAGLLTSQVAGNGANVYPNGYPTDTLSTMPDNVFHQFALKGTYAIAPKTKIVGGVSYGYNAQNSGYVNADQMASLPQSSLNGKVETYHADFKISDQSIKDLTLTTGFKYNERNNNTAANIYDMYALSAAYQPSYGSSSTNYSHMYPVASIPMSNKQQLFDFSSDYRIDKEQTVKVGYQYEKINRWCNSSISTSNTSDPAAAGFVSSSTSQPSTPASGITSPTTTGSCAMVPDSNENKLDLSYRLKANDGLMFNIGYGFSYRKSAINPNYYNPLMSLVGTSNYTSYKTGSTTTYLGNTTANTGVNLYSAGTNDISGFVAFFDASRIENSMKANVNWEPTDKMSVGLGGKLAVDNYMDETYGVNQGASGSINLDTVYRYTDRASTSFFVTKQNRYRSLNNGTSGSSVSRWNNNLNDDSWVLGIGTKYTGLMSGKLTLAGDVVYTRETTAYSTSGAGCSSTPATGGVTCGDVPPISTKTVIFKISGDYAIDKQSSIIGAFVYQRLLTNDYLYNAYQMGYTPTSLLATNQQSPNYSVGMIYLGYKYSFGAK